MAGDDLKHVRPGDPLRIPAKAFNFMLDGAKLAHAQRQGGAPIPSQPRSTGIVRVKNASGAAVERFGVLGIDAPLVLPSADLNQFKNEVILSCITPTIADHTGKFVVLLEPLAVGAIGKAYIDGVCPAKVDFQSATDEWADVGATAANLVSGSTGAAKILWSPEAAGVQWAVVRIGGGGGGSPPANGIDIQITGYSTIPDVTNRWSYSWTEVEPDELGAWVTKPGGLTSAGSGFIAYNSVEANNSATGMQGNSTTAEEATLRPIQGNPVVFARWRTDCVGATFLSFQLANASTGGCTPA